MKQGLVLPGIVLLGLLGLLSGCGGGGGSSPAGVAASPYQGHWIGTWQDDGGNYGPLQVTVAGDGSFSLSINNDYRGEVGSGDGKIKSSGALSANYSFDDTPNLTASGTVTKTDGTHLSGNMATRLNGVLQTTSTVTLRAYGTSP